MERVQVVIPVYQNQLSESEFHSLRQVCKVLKRYPLVIVKPESLDVSNWKEIYPLLEIESFPDEYFKGISGYNRLMLSELFYSRFVERTEYLLIYQLDAYVFRDELEEWCNKGYDYVGAPWIQRPVYNRLPVSVWMRLSRWHSRVRKEPSRQDLYNKVGNGGFSLRHVAHHLAAVRKYKEKIVRFLSYTDNHFYNEDVFWATEVPEFHYPKAAEALRFSFDRHPAYCFRLTHGKLPFGCHAWSKKRMIHFWKDIIYTSAK
ncbi:hypothetical protein B5F77_07475 [Parabacteroides sp. An277]|uniref:DUF5672 family protein n=1 Tax=Parabacteroides sp. An277 TaxID=1965619 RepID=UPI000B388C35|nr:DUF5672 family protein [Parabacteroides sp. An277]OUO52714.1 hypothetical protein B5F77_07475 [Parabacteroides sp. An277]